MNEISAISGNQPDVVSNSAAREFDEILAQEIAKAAAPIGMMMLSGPLNLVLKAASEQGSE